MTDESQVWISGDEDGAHLICDKDACMVATANGRSYWWSEEIPYRSPPETVVEQANRHRATHNEGST